MRIDQREFPRLSAGAACCFALFFNFLLTLLCGVCLLSLPAKGALASLSVLGLLERHEMADKMLETEKSAN